MKGVRSARAGETLTRFVKLPVSVDAAPPAALQLAPGHPAILEGRSYFPKSVKAPGSDPLVSGHSNVKIGRDVRKGRWKGYWIYTLSLEERATCPPSCHHWRACYGNKMPFAKRLQHGAALEVAVEAQLARLLAVKGRVGVLVRLHALGDFHSFRYVAFWQRMLAEHPHLAVFGYTARGPTDDIGRFVQTLLINRFGDRAAIRFSNSGQSRNATVPIKRVEDCPPGAFVCPEQTGRTLACATCAACWSTTRNVAFLEH